MSVKQLKAALQAADSDHHLATMTLRVVANHCVNGAAVYMCGHPSPTPAFEPPQRDALLCLRVRAACAGAMATSMVGQTFCEQHCLGGV